MITQVETNIVQENGINKIYWIHQQPENWQSHRDLGKGSRVILAEEGTETPIILE